MSQSLLVALAFISGSAAVSLLHYLRTRRHDKFEARALNFILSKTVVKHSLIESHFIEIMKHNRMKYSETLFVHYSKYLLKKNLTALKFDTLLEIVTTSANQTKKKVKKTIKPTTFTQPQPTYLPASKRVSPSPISRKPMPEHTRPHTLDMSKKSASDLSVPYALANLDDGISEDDWI